MSVIATAAVPSRLRRCLRLRSTDSAFSPSRRAGEASEAVCSVRKVARSASLPSWREYQRLRRPSNAIAGLLGSRSAGCRGPPAASGGRPGHAASGACSAAALRRGLATERHLGRQLLVAYDGPVAPRDVGDLHAVVTAAVLGVERVDLGPAPGRARTRSSWRRARPTGRGRRGWRRCAAARSGTASAPRTRSRGSPSTAAARSCVGRGGADQLLEPLDPRDALVVGVPGERDHAARAAARGRSRAAPARGRTSGTTGRTPPRRPSASATGSARRSRRRGSPATRLASRASISRIGVGGEHVVAGPVEHLGELAGAGAELEHGRASRPGQPGDRGGRGTTGGLGRRRRPPGRRTVRGRHRLRSPCGSSSHRALEVTR